MIDRHPAAANVQCAIENQRSAFCHDTLVVGLVFPGFERIAHGTFNDAFTDDVFASGAEDLQVAVVAALQQPLAVADINRVRRAVDQRAHEFKLIVQCALGGLALIDLAPHVRIPGHGNQQ
ncbi:hypothetical protein D3C76_1412370 [compost metagenome]